LGRAISAVGRDRGCVWALAGEDTLVDGRDANGARRGSALEKVPTEPKAPKAPKHVSCRLWQVPCSMFRQLGLTLAHG
jgi:hypothetical protein